MPWLQSSLLAHCSLVSKGTLNCQKTVHAEDSTQCCRDSAPEQLVTRNLKSCFMTLEFPTAHENFATQTLRQLSAWKPHESRRLQPHNSAFKTLFLCTMEEALFLGVLMPCGPGCWHRRTGGGQFFALLADARRGTGSFFAVSFSAAAARSKPSMSSAPTAMPDFGLRCSSTARDTVKPRTKKCVTGCSKSWFAP